MSTLAELSDACNSFENPTFTVRLGGVEMPQTREQVQMRELEVTLSGTEKAGALRIRAEVLDPKGSDAQTWLAALELGAKAELALGYDSTETDVFCGLLCEVCFSAGEDAANAFEISALCFDAKALMMTSGHFVFSGKKKAGAVAQEILSRSQYAGFIGSKSVTAPPEAWNLPVLHSLENDYEVLRALAESLCYEFYIFADKLYFGKPRTETAPTVEFDGSEGLLSLERSARLREQAEKCVVTGYDDTGERITFTKSRPGETRLASAKLSSVLSGSVLSRVESGVKTMDQATYVAEERMKQSVNRYGALECVCCGLPQIRPGRFVKISGVRAQFNGDYYVREVTHRMDDKGFTTDFTAEG